MTIILSTVLWYIFTFRYEGPKHLNVKLLEKEGDVAEWPPIGSSLRVADKEYLTMNVEDTTVQVRYKLYRKRPNS